MENFKVIIVEDVPLELKGTEGLLRNEVPEAEVIGTASDETQFIQLMRTGNPDLILLDLGLGGSTTIGVEICRSVKVEHPEGRHYPKNRRDAYPCRCRKCDVRQEVCIQPTNYGCYRRFIPQERYVNGSPSGSIHRL